MEEQSKRYGLEKPLLTTHKKWFFDDKIPLAQGINKMLSDALIKTSFEKVAGTVDPASNTINISDERLVSDDGKKLLSTLAHENTHVRFNNLSKEKYTSLRTSAENIFGGKKKYEEFLFATAEKLGIDSGMYALQFRVLGTDRLEEEVLAHIVGRLAVGGYSYDSFKKANKDDPNYIKWLETYLNTLSVGESK